jgi:hypothetical protein
METVPTFDIQARICDKCALSFDSVSYIDPDRPDYDICKKCYDVAPNNSLVRVKTFSQVFGPEARFGVDSFPTRVWFPRIGVFGIHWHTRAVTGNLEEEKSVLAFYSEQWCRMVLNIVNQYSSERPMSAQQEDCFQDICRDLLLNAPKYGCHTPKSYFTLLMGMAKCLQPTAQDSVLARCCSFVLLSKGGPFISNAQLNIWTENFVGCCVDGNIDRALNVLDAASNVNSASEAERPQMGISSSCFPRPFP